MGYPCCPRLCGYLMRYRCRQVIGASPVTWYNESMPIQKYVNREFFTTWSRDMAYVLGFFFADGSMDVNPRGAQYLSLQIKDLPLFESIRTVMEAEHRIA